MTKEAMKLALEALELVNLEFVCGNGSHHAKKDRHEWDEDCPITDRWKKAITALREALAEQPAQQEPFAFYFETYSYEGQKSTRFVACPCDGKLNGKPGIPLYTFPLAQRTWVGLTDEERDAHEATPIHLGEIGK